MVKILFSRISSQQSSRNRHGILCIFNLSLFSGFFLQENELYYTQLLDVEYQRHPLNEEKILAVFDLVNASTLAADVKQKFYSRRYEFIDDLGSDVNR